MFLQESTKKNLYSRNLSIIPIKPENLYGQFRDMSAELICSLCRNIVYPQPVSCGLCQKLFCKKCLDEYKNSNRGNCPTGHQYSESSIDPLVKGFLDNIFIICPNFKKGCQIRIKYADYSNHFEVDCDYTTYTCNSCKLIDNKIKIISHVSICDQVLEPCKYCTKSYLKRDLLIHFEKCEMKMLECKYCRKIFIMKLRILRGIC